MFYKFKKQTKVNKSLIKFQKSPTIIQKEILIRLMILKMNWTIYLEMKNQA